MNAITIYTSQGGSATIWADNKRVYSTEPLSAETANWLDREGFFDALLGRIEEDICTESKFIEEALKS